MAPGEPNVNMLLVAEGVRPAWLANGYRCGELRRLIRERGLPLRAGMVRAGSGAHRVHAPLVVRADAPAVTKQQSHASLGRLLGLPCQSQLAWEDPALCHAFMVYLSPARGCPKGAADRDTYITSFWCASRRAGAQWCRAFIRAARAFEARHLAPRGYRMVASMNTPL